MARNAIDFETGEIIGEPPFVKLYVRDICNVKGLSAPLYKMFNFMLMNMNFENVVSYGPSSKRKFLQDSGIANSTFDNNVSKLIASGLIERVSKGEFRVNKKYAVRVDWAKVQSIQWTSTYTKNGKIEEVKFT